MAVGLAIDANRCVDFARGGREALGRIQAAVQIYVLAELRAGFLCGSRSERNEANLTRYADSDE